ncbi:IS66 family transposase, partial [Escherichia coli]|uniref:IS66 family transposase n=1 Tax=Escherichia coli TaxID=562 RepID=UPI002F427013
EEECCPACGGELSSLGCDVSEQLELISSAFKVIETQRPKQACCRCDHIVQAPVPSKPIARSYAGAGLLAHVVTGKYADHLPLYRQSEIYRRQGVELSRATLGRWTGAVAELLEPLYDVVHARAPTYITTEALQRIGELYAIEAEVRGCSAEQRLAARKARAAPLM